MVGYEELRQKVLAGDRRGPGLAVLLGRGMKAWLDVVGSLDAPGISPQAQFAAETGLFQTVPAGWRSPLTAVLTGMVFRNWQGGRQA